MLTTLQVELKEYQIINNQVNPPTSKDPNTKQLFDYLKLKFEKQSGVSTILDLVTLTQTKFLNDGTLETQLNSLQELCSCCTLNKTILKDWQFATFILIGLPESYNHIKDSFLTTSDITALKPTDVCVRIIETEIHQKAESSSSTNIITSGGNKQKKKLPPVGKPCFYCNKEGHWAQDCRKKKRDNNASPSNQKGATPSTLVRVVKPNLLFCVHQRYSEGVSRSKGECGGLSWLERVVGGVVRGYRKEEVSNKSI